MTEAVTFNIQRFSTGDGPGIRTTVFFKGCPLRCAWCHNPEGLRAGAELMWHDTRCIGHRGCIRACPLGALEMTPEGLRIDRAKCDSCGRCADACPASALEVIGRRWSPEDLHQEVVKDKVFFETSGGGLTVSGGEPMVQWAFLAEFLPLCRGSGVHVALDTCGAASLDRYGRILPLVDMALFDLKIMDPAGHEAATGVKNGPLLDAARVISESGKPMWIRTPVVPGYTDSEENVAAIGAFIRDRLGTVERWDLLAYTNLGRPKYKRLDLKYAPGDAPLLAKQRMEELHAVAVSYFKNAVWSGATR